MSRIGQETFQPGRYFKPPPPPVKRPLRDLTARENEVVAERRAAVHALGQDAVDFVGELHKAGMIDGWRSVGEVVLFNGSPSTGSGRTV